MSFLFTAATWLHHYVLIEGLVAPHIPYPPLKGIQIGGQPVQIEQVSLPETTTFRVQALLSQIPTGTTPVHLLWADGTVHTTTLGNAMQDANPTYPETRSLMAEFLAICKQDDVQNILDIGERARSGTLLARWFTPKTVTVLDIVDAPEVHVVCDAHAMSTMLPEAYFDAILASSIFEHLIMPWKVVVEMNRVMRVGGTVFISTSQTCGLHDFPWDYYRFSSDSWKGLFNTYTGFELLGATMNTPLYIIPVVQNELHSNKVEQVPGFFDSFVLARKTGPCLLDWPLQASDVTDDHYPST